MSVFLHVVDCNFAHIWKRGNGEPTPNWVYHRSLLTDLNDKATLLGWYGVGGPDYDMDKEFSCSPRTYMLQNFTLIRFRNRYHTMGYLLSPKRKTMTQTVSKGRKAIKQSSRLKENMPCLPVQICKYVVFINVFAMILIHHPSFIVETYSINLNRGGYLICHPAS
jgi:hypothetical protein